MNRFLFFLIILMPTVTVAQSASPKPGNTKNAVYALLQKHFKIIDSMEIDYEVKEEEYKKLVQTINHYKIEIFKLESLLLQRFFCVAKSADNKLCLLSWDTRLGGTMIDYATMALYKKNDGTIQSIKLKGDDDGDDYNNTKMHYDTIYTIATIKRTLYLAHGSGQGSTILPWQQIRALALEKDQLVPAIVFPDKESTIDVMFDLSHFKQRSYMPIIKVKDKGKTIRIPEPDDREGFAGKYQTFILSGSRYIKKK